MKERLDAIKENALSQIKATDSLDKLNDIRVAFLGKKGELTEVLKGMKEVAPEDRPKVGQIVNETRQAIEEVLEAARKELAAKKRELQMKAEVIDVTLPAKKAELGHKHPNMLAREEIEKIFTSNDSILVQNLTNKGIDVDGVTKISLMEASIGIATIVTFIAIYLGIIFLIASAAILALKQLTESSDNKQRYTILREIGCDEKMINKALFRQIGIFFGLPLILAIIHSIFGIQFAMTMMEGLASSEDLLPSIVATVVIIGVIYGAYFLATYFGSKNIIKEEE